MRKIRWRSYRFSVLLCLIFVVCACSSPSGTTSSNNGVVTQTESTPISTTLPTETSCPAEGQGRAAVLAPLKSRNQNSIIYTYNTPDDTIVIRRYDLQTQQKTDILSLTRGDKQYALPINARLSPDGQWVYFVHKGTVQMLRVDGKMLQTLYCTTGTPNLLLSPDQSKLAIGGSFKTGGLSLLDMKTGKITSTVTSPPGAIEVYQPFTWRDNNNLYVSRLFSGIGGGPTLFGRCDRGGLYLLENITQNTFAGEKQLKMFIDWHTLEPCRDFDVDNDMIITSANYVKGSKDRIGPGTITFQNRTDQTEQTFTEPDHAIIYARFISDKHILYITQNAWGNSNSQQPYNFKYDDYRLWTINSDGTDKKLLTTLPGTDNVTLHLYAYAKNVMISPDNKWYALKTSNKTLAFGTLEGGNITTFATGDDNIYNSFDLLQFVGWSNI